MLNHFVKKGTTASIPVSGDVESNSDEKGPKELICKPTLIEPWRVFRIMAEFVEGFDLLRKYGLAATFFGTARCSLDDDLYKRAEDLAARLSKSGFTIITGGASGIMEAANKGAYGAEGQSVGLNIRLPHEQRNNRYLTDSIFFHHFYVRKVMLSFASEVYIFFPGGFGTLDEFFEIVTLVQTKKIKKVPVIIVGKEYWTPLLSFIETTLYTRYRAISADDMKIYHLVDTVDEAYELSLKLVEC